LAYFYAGLGRYKFSLSTITMCMLAIAIVSIQWFFWGYSLVYSNTGNPMFGNMDFLVLRNVDETPHPLAPTIPGLLFMFYQLFFAVITPALVLGGPAERVTIHAFMVFLFVWSTLVYDFVAYWTWNKNGWLFQLGGLDFAGGGPVHIASGFGALAFALVVGHRPRGPEEQLAPHSISNVVLGTTLLWFGWFGFNGGSEFAADSRAVNACVVTNIAASVGGVTWFVLEFIKTRKWSAVAFCGGAVAGLVCITPGSGFVSPASSFVFGLVGPAASFYALPLKKKLRVDDSFDAFAVHGIGGAFGGVLTGIFAEARITSLGSGTPTIPGGWLDHNWNQIGYQIAGICAISGWSFVMTLIIVKLMDLIPGFQLRPKKGENIEDSVYMGENANEYIPLALHDVTFNPKSKMGPRGRPLKSSSAEKRPHDSSRTGSSSQSYSDLEENNEVEENEVDSYYSSA